MLRARSRQRLDALEAKVHNARRERDRLKQELDGLKAAIRAAGQYANSRDVPDEREIAIVKIAATQAALDGRGWAPVTLTIRGQQVIVLVCGCDGSDPEKIYENARSLARTLRVVATG